jgi:hypothetical protein
MGFVELPCCGDGVEHGERAAFDAFGMGFVDAVALAQGVDRRLARVAVFGAADHVPQQAFAHRGFASLHGLDGERFDDGMQDDRAAGDDGASFVAEAGQLDRVDVAGLDQGVADFVEHRARDVAVLLAELVGDVADRLDRARRAPAFLPAARLVVGRELLQFQRDAGAGVVVALAGDLSAREILQRRGDAAHLQALAFERGITFADDEFGRAAADVDDEAALAAFRNAVRHAEIDQSRLLAAGHDLDRMPERGFGSNQEGARRFQLAHRVRADGPDAVVRQMGDALSELRQAGEGLTALVVRQRTVFAEPGRQAHGFAQAVDHLQLAFLVAGHDQMEAVRSEIDRGQLLAFGQQQLHGRHPQSRASSDCCAECGIASPTPTRV